MRLSFRFLLIIALTISAVAVSRSQGQTTIKPRLPDVDTTQLFMDVQTLASDAYMGRKTGTAGAAMAREYVSRRLAALGVRKYGTTYERPFTYGKGKAAVSIVGYIQGAVDSAIVISAHYDHLGVDSTITEGDRIFNGADDNASGVAALLSAASYFMAHKPHHTIILAAFDAEEVGLRGAYDFVEHPPCEVSLITLDINIDMIGRSDYKQLFVAGVTPFPVFAGVIRSAASLATNVQLKTGHDAESDGADNWTDQSDHYPFFSKGIPYLYFGVEDHADYHTVNDNYSGIMPAFFVEAARIVIFVARGIDSQHSK